MPLQSGFYFAEFNSISADLYLTISTADKLKISITQHSRQIAGLKNDVGWILRQRIRNEHLFS